jgi:hypothetical protein
VGITKQHDHDKARHQAKVNTPDYVDRFRDEGDRFARGGAATDRPRIADIRNLDALGRRMHSANTAKIAQVFEARVRSIAIRIDDLVFSLKFTPLQFAAANPALHPAKVKTLYPLLASEVAQRLEMTKKRLLSAPPVARSEVNAAGKRHVRLYRTFRTFLTPADPEPWQRLCKELRLIPVAHEPNHIS